MIALPFILNTLLNFAVGLLVARFLGPAEYGRYALALSIAVVIQTLALDWLRLCASRFYSDHDRLAHPEIRATLDLLVAGIVVVAGLAAGLVALSGLAAPLAPGLCALAIGTAVANGLFDIATALIRARFLDRAYGRLVVTKTVLSLALTVGGAFVFGSAAMALGGLVLSTAGSLVASQRALLDGAARPCHADLRLVARFAVYALPIVVANVLYQAVPAANRALVARVDGFVAAGQLALAFELGIRVIGAIGSTFDVLLFQIAVLAEKTLGARAARQQVSRNMAIQLAVLLPAVAGCWLILPSFEHLLVPPAFRGPFAHYFALMLPAILCFALANYCIGPAFQIAHRTLPLIVGGLVAAGADGLAILLLPATGDATRFAIAQSLASIAGLCATVGFLFTLEPMWPERRDVIGIASATLAMILVVAPLRGLEPGLVALAAQAGLGVTVYGAVIVAFDVARLRAMLAQVISSRSSPWSGTLEKVLSKVRRAKVRLP